MIHYKFVFHPLIISDIFYHDSWQFTEKTDETSENSTFSDKWVLRVKMLAQQIYDTFLKFNAFNTLVYVEYSKQFLMKFQQVRVSHYCPRALNEHLRMFRIGRDVQTCGECRL